jgi:hypothetical protein
MGVALLLGNARFVGMPLPLIESKHVFEHTQVGGTEKFLGQVAAATEVFFLHCARRRQKEPPSFVKLA